MKKIITSVVLIHYRLDALGFAPLKRVSRDFLAASMWLTERK